MKHKLAFLMLTVSLAVPAAAAQEQLPSAETLQGLTAEWVKLKQTTSAERQAWQEQRIFLEKEFTLLQEEKARLEKEIQEAEQSENAFMKEKAALLKDRESFQKMLDGTAAGILRAEGYLKQWKPRIPPALAENFNKLLKDLQYAPEASASQQLQAIFALYTELDTLQNSFHVTHEFLTFDGVEQEFKILYQGLSRAFAVSVDGKRAAVGVPAETGWQWSREDGLRGAIRDALAYYQKEEVAALVELPLEVRNGAAA